MGTQARRGKPVGSLAAAPAGARGRRWRLWAVLAVGLLAAGAGVGVLIVMAQTPPPRFELPSSAAQFDGDRAFGYLEKICALGPRITGTDAMAKQQEVLTRHFETLGATVERQPFPVTRPSRPGETVQAANLIVHWHPRSTRRVLLGAHYDTRPIADQEPVLRNRAGVFLGANDGGSGVALLMELGRQIGTLELAVGVDFVFFDAEEYIFVQGQDRYFLGSEDFVREYRARPAGFRYEAVVVVDMVGDKDLEIYPDQRSMARAGALVREIWSIAQARGARPFRWPAKHDILDDHLAFQAAGIPAIVLIDFDFPHWHRLTDTPEQCSGASLATVAGVLVDWLGTRR